MNDADIYVVTPRTPRNVLSCKVLAHQLIFVHLQCSDVPAVAQALAAAVRSYAAGGEFENVYNFRSRLSLLAAIS